MSVENGEWVMYGIDEDDEYCLHTVEELEKYIDTVGFLPLFRCEIPGFSVEERTVAAYWWSGDAERDPWEWRAEVARRGHVAYGKFFNRKAGFISKEWLPYFANFRRDGYDFDSLWEDGKANRKMKMIMDCVMTGQEMLSHELKARAGFGKGGEKGFDGVVNALQMQTYLVVKDFRQKRNKKGEPYGWSIAVYCCPEDIFGYDHVRSAYKEDPKASRERIKAHLMDIYPVARQEMVEKLLGK